MAARFRPCIRAKRAKRETIRKSSRTRALPVRKGTAPGAAGRRAERMRCLARSSRSCSADILVLVRVLIVEDEPKMADVLRRGLARAGLAS